MEENNNKFETNQNDSMSGSALYGNEPEPQTDGNSSVYGQQLQSDNLSAEPQESVSAPVQLEKPEPPYQAVNNQPFQQNPSGVYGQAMPNQGMNGNPTGYPNQGMNGNPTGYPNQGMNGSPMGYPNQGMNGTPTGYPNQGMNGSPTGYPNQGMNGNPTGYPNQGMNGNTAGYNGQPNYQNQPEFQPGFMPGQNQGDKPKKGKAGLVIGIIAVIAVVLIVAICVLASKSLFGSDPKEQITKGMKMMAEEMDSYSNAIMEENTIDALRELINDQPIHSNVEVSITDPSPTSSFDNFGIAIDAVTDNANKQAKYDLAVGTSGFNMDLGSIVADDSMLYISVPLLFDDEVYSLDLEHFGEDFQDSAWADLLGVEIPADYSASVFEIAELEENEDLGQELADIFKKATDKMNAAAEYSIIKEKKDFEIGGKTVSCGGVRVTISKDVYNEAMEELKNDILTSEAYADILAKYEDTYDSEADDFKEQVDEAVETLMSLRFEQDCALDFYMDSKGRIVNISTPFDLEVSSLSMEIDAVALDISFTGEAQALDEIEGGLYVKAGNQVAYLGISRQASVTEELYSEQFSITLQDNSHENDITFEYSNDWDYSAKSYDLRIAVESEDTNMELKADGEYTEMTKEKGYSFSINNAIIRIDDEDMLIMSGSLEVEPTTEKIEVPESATNLLEMSESDIELMLYGAISAIQ